MCYTVVSFFLKRINYTFASSNLELMNKLPSLLRRPADINDKPWITVMLCTVTVVIALAILEPLVFRFNDVNILCLLIGLSVLAFLSSSLFFVFIPKIFPRFFSTTNWTIGRMYTHWGVFVLFSGIAIFSYQYFLLQEHNSNEYWKAEFFHQFFLNLVAAISVGLIPLFISNYFTRNRNLQSNLMAVRGLNEKLSKRQSVQISPKSIVLEGANKEMLSVNLNDVLYIESSGSYVSIVCRDGDANRNRLLLCSIKHIEDVLLPYAVFVRCHRAYIVNVNQISTISAHEQGYRLNLFDTLEIIPVSHTYLADLQEVLK